MRVPRKELFKFIFNLIFAIYHCVLGLASRSWWFLAVGAYYIVLGTMQMGVIAFSKGDKKNEIFVMRFSGILIFLLAVVLCGIVYMTVEQDVATKYHEIAMITIALYAFTKITLAIMGFVKEKKKQRAYGKTMRSIALVDAVVSIYSLQRSMLVSFEGLVPEDIMLLNILSGIGMCVIVVGIGVYLMIGGRKNGKVKISSGK